MANDYSVKCPYCSDQRHLTFKCYKAVQLPGGAMACASAKYTIVGRWVGSIEGVDGFEPKEYDEVSCASCNWEGRVRDLVVFTPVVEDGPDAPACGTDVKQEG